MSDTTTRRAGRGWAYTGMGIGLATSIWANVASVHIPPAGTLPDWSPKFGAIIFAILWPVAVLVGLEIFARYEWPPGWRGIAQRYIGLVPVIAVAAVVSYRHMSRLLHYYGEDNVTATFGPLAVDGLMVMSAGALITTAVLSRVAGPPARRARRKTPTTTADVPGQTDTLDTSATDVIPDEPAAELGDDKTPPQRLHVVPQSRQRRLTESERRAIRAHFAELGDATPQVAKAERVKLAERYKVNPRTIQRTLNDRVG